MPRLTIITLLSLITSVHATQTSLLRRKLASCVNTAPDEGLDEGCDAIHPICLLSNGYEPAANVAGNKCGKCINTINSELFSDLGCSPETPLCDAPSGKGGTVCLAASSSSTAPACTNTAANGGVDAGCSGETPICINSKTGKEVGANAPGDVCVACVRVYSRFHYRFGLKDSGCGSSRPRCMTSSNSDPAKLKTGAKCCTAKGSCEAQATCPCNRPDSIWSKVVAGINPWNSSDLSCISSSTSASLFVTGTPSGIGTGEVDLSDTVRWWVCSDQPKVSLTITEAEGRACLAEVQAATKVMGVSECLSY